MRSRRPPLLLLAILLGSMLFGSATAEGDAPEPAPAFSLLANTTISCSSAWPSSTVGCFVERPVLVLGAFELAVGADAQAVLTGGLDDAHLAPYLVVAAYLDTWSAWAEVRLPELSGVPLLGSPEYLRVGFSLRIPP